MSWFVVQRMSARTSGGVTYDYIGPFFGDPTKILSLLGSNEFVMVYSNGAWADLPRPPMV